MSDRMESALTIGRRGEGVPAIDDFPFYDSVVPGGVVVFDDYGFWSGCRKAVDEFLAERSIKVSLTPIDAESHYFIKQRA